MWGRHYRQPIVLTVAMAGGLGACGGNTTGSPPPTAETGGAGGGGGGGSDAGPGSECPEQVPVDGTSCAVEQECTYPYCGNLSTQTARCAAQRWRITPNTSCNPPPPPPPVQVCPVTPPVDGTACSGNLICSYAGNGCCTGPTAQCIAGVWLVPLIDCPLPGDCPVRPCEGLDFCDCFARSDCRYLTDSCICPCDYQCAGQPDCECGCGGGTYLGCAPRE
jgi:hypothetical protein